MSICPCIEYVMNVYNISVHVHIFAKCCFPLQELRTQEVNVYVNELLYIIFTLNFALY